jgi:hypothetical protein
MVCTPTLAKNQGSVGHPEKINRRTVIQHSRDGCRRQRHDDNVQTLAPQRHELTASVLRENSNFPAVLNFSFENRRVGL